MIEFVKACVAVSTPLVISGLYSAGLIGIGVCGLSGAGLSRRRWGDVPPSVYIGVAFGLGSGLAATIWLLLSFIGLFRGGVVIAVLGAALLVNAIASRSVWIEALRGLRDVGRGLLGETWSWRAVAVAVVVLVILHAVSALHPATGDSVAFYLPWARVIADAGRVIALPGYEAFSDIWTVAEIQMAALMMVFRDAAAKSLPFWHAVFSAVLLWGAARSANFGLRGGVLAVAMLFTSSAVTLIVWDGKTDLVALPIALAAIILAALKQRDLAGRQSLIIGLLTGAAVASKLSYLPVIGAGLLSISLYRFWKAWKRDGRGRLGAGRDELASLIAIGIGCALIVAPQMIRNWLMTGEPLAPFVYLKGGESVLEQNWFSAATTRWIALTYPLALTYGLYWGQHGNMSLMALGFLPLCFVFLRPVSATLGMLMLAALSGLGVWLILKTSVIAPRYILFALALCLLPMAGAAARASVAGPRLVRVLIVLMAFYSIWSASYTLYRVLPVSVSYASNKDVEAYDYDNSFTVARMLNAEVPPGTRVALLNYYRYPMRADLLECVIGLEDLPPGTPGNLTNYYLNGAQYVVFDLSTHKAVMELVMAETPSWMTLTPYFLGSRLRVYRMTVAEDAPRPGFRCEKVGRIWRRTPVT